VIRRISGGRCGALTRRVVRRVIGSGTIICLVLLPVAGEGGVVQDQPLRFLSTVNQVPAMGQRIAMARATWDTGWFQAEILRCLLENLGYVVDTPQTMDNQDFYTAVANGEVDLWANGWFPSHNAFLQKASVHHRVEAVGFEVKAGALQGYLVDKKSADRLGVKRLSDLKDPAVAAAYDGNGNGRADLIGCHAGWGCERIVEHHLDAYQLRDTVEHVQEDYSAAMHATVARFKQGKPILFYTWTPNWTVGTLVPGRDVIWLEVPFASLPADVAVHQEKIAVGEVAGCSSDPCAMGFPPNDIRAVANRAFLEQHPDVKRLLQLVEIPLEDISRQNARMLDGEDTYDDIRRHADGWVSNNRDRLVRWLKAARRLQVMPTTAAPPADDKMSAPSLPLLRVVTQRSEPFVSYQDRGYTGFSIELWEKIANQIEREYEIYAVDTIAKLLDDVKRGAADVAISGIGITSQRELNLDFSHAYYESGLQIMVPEGSGSLLAAVVLKAMAIIFSRGCSSAWRCFFSSCWLPPMSCGCLNVATTPSFPSTTPRGSGMAYGGRS
jgi:ABC-type proline/glycine betaine transport system substrate-binding protein